VTRLTMPLGPGKRFVLDEFHRLSMLASLQRSSTYRREAPDREKRAFRASLKNRVETISADYQDPVTDEAHILTLSRLAETLSLSHGDILRGGRFRVGVAQKYLNLYLKYLWCAGWAEMPPHCPFDSIIMRLLPAPSRVPWTKLDGVAAYRRLVESAGIVAEHRSLAVWELEEYSALSTGAT
jgi:hypothetical protein